MPLPAHRLASMLRELGTVTDEPGRLTRTFLSPAMARANTLVGRWMTDAGLSVRVDSAGNLIGRLAAVRPDARTLLLGSHLDTVRNAGRFDGALGVLLPVVVLESLGRRGIRLPFHVEVLGFSEEEGVRFASAYLGSEAYAGRLRARSLRLLDPDGTSVGAALAAFNGRRFRLPRAAHRRKDLIGYVETHLEQGPVLEAAGLPVGVVSAIAGQSRFQLTWQGQAGHAGTTPMDLRRDALTGAAEFALAVEQLARRSRGLVATIGALAVTPGAANVIPGAVAHTLDVRHVRDSTRRAARLRLHRTADAIARRRRLSLRWVSTQDNAAVACSPSLTAFLERSVCSVQGRSLALGSGAGHDAVVLSHLAPVAMLFVRCRDGLSHHPREHVATADLGVALRVVTDFLQRLAADHS